MTGAGLLWVPNDDGGWSAELEGREHDYGDGLGLDMDVFEVDVEPAAGGIWRVGVEHAERGQGVEETHLACSIADVLSQAEIILRRSRTDWEERADAETERRESLDE